MDTENIIQAAYARRLAAQDAWELAERRYGTPSAQESAAYATLTAWRIAVRALEYVERCEAASGGTSE